ncbi:MAG: putative NEK protein kinase [Streblomastix strix]|uniref:Putative NEK protein kinase n=1 Tax=Streblomastix strix TaxID=222440 RepID=A0A5J4X5P2_9EUKA|nr:MAG: putative NEK protein kinase [Streblomastix strix]
MSSQAELYEVIEDYYGWFLIVIKGDIVKVIRKELNWFIIEKDGKVGKVPAQNLRPYSTHTPQQSQSLIARLKQSEILDQTEEVSVTPFEEDVKYEDFEIDHKFFGGAMGKTFLVKYKPSGELYVMKRGLKWFDLFGPSLKELICIQSLNTRVWELFAQIILAVNFMHSVGVIHRDIKPENIFIMEDGSARLGDFGLSLALNDKYYATRAGTRNYMGPEVLMQGKMYFSSDIYALGIVIYEFLTGKHPFMAQQQDQDIVSNIKQGKYADIPEWIPADLSKLIFKMIDIV